MPGILFSAIMILAATALYGVLHSWLASRQAKALAQNHLGNGATRFYRLAYNAVGVITLLPVLALPAALPDRLLYTIPFPWVFLTGAIQMLAALALLVGVLQTGLLSFAGLSQLTEPTAEQPPRLVIHGLYRYVRHPLYNAGLVFIWLTPVMTTNLFALYFGFSAYLIIGAYFEERKLKREFGEEYLRYAARTPMLVPWKRKPH